MNSPEDWLTMTDAQRKAIRRKWNPYEGDGQDVARIACARLKDEQVLKRIQVKRVHPGIHHGGTVVITVVLGDGCERDTKGLPHNYLGFPVVYF